jgi:hypothetical protein
MDETRIREYVQWQESKEREIEKLQGNLFDETEDQLVTAHLLVQKTKPPPLAVVLLLVSRAFGLLSAFFISRQALR